MSKRRRPKNKAEGAFYDALSAEGWDVCKRGWPDFFCERGDEIMAVEVKPHPHFNLKKDQHRIAAHLARHGIPMYRWDPINGLERIGV